MERLCPTCGFAVKRVKAGRFYVTADADPDTGKLLNYRKNGDLSYHNTKKTFYRTSKGSYAVHDCKRVRPVFFAVEWELPVSPEDLQPETIISDVNQDVNSNEL